MKSRSGLAFLIALVSAGMYLAWSAWRGAVGFPLDDAWIHQVYARNLGTRFEFAFFAGQPSAGSTSPLWSMLLAIGYLLHIDFRVWTYILGIALLGSSAFVSARLANRLFTVPLSTIPLFLLFEWHLAWSAVSGMEILLFVFLSLILLERLYARAKPGWLGILAGLLTLTRPEGSVLAGLVSVGFILDADQRGQTRITQVPASRLTFYVLRFTFYIIGFLLVITPYLLFNLSTTGTPFPNTFYAKAAEYAELFARAPLVLRWLELLWTPFIGAQILLIPGLLYAVAMLVMKRRWLALIPFAWLLILPALYAMRLPVTYQHGRYEMPVIPFIAIYGVWGASELFARIKIWVVQTTWGLSLAATLILFWLLGAAQYATDVAIVNCEMVQTARWVAANAPSDAVIAAHDIGALGYFYNRPFIDLAGLVSPEVIPFIRDENRLRAYLFAREVRYVVVFPDWYATLKNDARLAPVFQTDCAVTRNAGEQNMIVYKLVR